MTEETAGFVLDWRNPVRGRRVDRLGYGWRANYVTFQPISPSNLDGGGS